MHRVALTLALLVCVGCGSSSPSAPTTPPVTTPPPAAQAVVTVSAPTGIIQPTASGEANLPFLAQWTVTLTETAGLGGNVNFYRLGFADDFARTAFNVGADRVIRDAGSNHVPARGTFQLPMGIVYRGTFGSSTAVFHFEIDFTDDHGNHQTLTGNVTASNQ
jgi:hypothetical protein